MAIKTAIGSGVNNGQRDLPSVPQPAPVPSIGTWTRPTDWPALPTMTSSDQVLNGLVAVTNDASNFMALKLTMAAGPGPASSLINNGVSTSVAGNVFLPVGGLASSLAGIQVNQFVSGGTTLANTIITSVAYCTFTVTSGTSATMIVNSVTSGSLAPGTVVTYGASLATTRYITAQTSGTTGGVGTYTLSGSPGQTPTGGVYVTVNNSQLVTTGFTAAINGSYTVDWGDGASQLVQSGIIVSHQYDYASLGTAVTTRGYKTAIITAVPTAGALTGVDIQQKYAPTVSIGGTWNSYVPKWLDISVGGPSISALSIGGSVINPYMLEQVSLYGVVSTYVAVGTSLFSNCKKLQSVPVLNLPPAYNSCSTMFTNCIQLKNIPVLPATTATNINCQSMFSGCTQLETIADSVFANVANKIGITANMFATCYSLKTPPMLTWSSVGAPFATDSMFINCVNLFTAPSYDLRYSSNVSGFYSGCLSLVYAPPMIAPLATIAPGIFTNCIALKIAPTINLPLAGDCSTMFSTCRSLQTVGNLNLPSATSFASMFATCNSLVSVGTITTSALLTSTASMFGTCTSLIVAPNITNTTNVLNWAGMFSSCGQLKSIPTYNTSNATNMSNMLTGCASLTVVPTFNTIKVTDMSTMFSGCSALKSIPAYDTANVINMSGMASACSSLTSVAITNTTKVSNLNSIFNGCFSLTDNSIIYGGPNSWNTANVTDMNTVFQACAQLTTIPAWDTTKVTTMQTMLTGCTNLISIPQLNMANCITSTILGPGPSCFTLSRVDVINTKTSINYSSGQLTKTVLETIFTNLVGNATSQTITITSNPGTDTAVSITTCSYTQGQAVATMTSGTTAGLSVGMVATVGPGWHTIACTFTNGDPVIICNQHGMSAGQTVSFAASGGTTILLNTLYTISGVQANGNGFTIQQYGGGGAELIPNAGGSTTLNRVPIITALTTSTVTMNMWASQTLSSQSLTFRRLNTRLASLKNWTISG